MADPGKLFVFSGGMGFFFFKENSDGMSLNTHTLTPLSLQLLH